MERAVRFPLTRKKASSLASNIWRNKMDKIKAFFQSKVTKIVAWVVLAICAVILIIGGATADSIASGVALVAGIVTAVAALVAFIAGQVSAKK
jgi:lipopolysaccharide export LptBFGC system permease protein LptF